MAVPTPCSFYNSAIECRKDLTCKHVHLCKYFVLGDCKFGSGCHRSHDIRDEQPFTVLKHAGVNMNRYPGEILNELKDAAIRHSQSSGAQGARNPNVPGRGGKGGKGKVNNPGLIHARDPMVLFPMGGSMHAQGRRGGVPMAGPMRAQGPRGGFPMRGPMHAQGPRGGVPMAGPMPAQGPRGGLPMPSPIYGQGPIGGVPMNNGYTQKRGKASTSGLNWTRMSGHQSPGIVPLKFGREEREEGELSDDSSDGTGSVSGFSSVSDRSRSSSSHPVTCKYYNRGNKGCRNEGNNKCTGLHVCRHYLMGDCSFGKECKRSHNIFDPQPKNVLRKCGIDVERSPKEVLAELRANEAEDSDDDDDDSNLGAAGGVRPARSRNKSRADNESSTSSVNNNKDLEICVFHLRGKCHYGKSCKHHHVAHGMPYSWQRREDTAAGVERWVEFDAKSQEEIEINFCDPAKDECFVKDAATHTLYKISFVAMKFDAMKPGVGLQATNDVRRLKTKSSTPAATAKHLYLTLWRWYWKDDVGQWVEYEQSKDLEDGGLTSYAIQEEFDSNPDSVISFKISHFKYTLDLRQMLQLNLSTDRYREVRRRPALFDPATKRPVQLPGSVMPALPSLSMPVGVGQGQPMSPQREGSGAVQPGRVSYPPTWNFDMHSDNDYFQVVAIQPAGGTAAEFKEIEQLFQATMPGVPLKSVKRIQNVELWDAFYIKKTKMEKKLQAVGDVSASPGIVANNSVKTLRLFHGTKQFLIDAICQQGFDFRLNGSSVGTLYGKGSYFARKASYSKDYTDCKTMFVAKVLIGEAARGNSTLVRPPPKDVNKPYGEMYDSCVDSVADPNIFVVFSEGQSYPEYLVEY